MIQQALEQLPVPFRKIIVLCVVEDMSYLSIADMVGIPIGTMMSRLSATAKSDAQIAPWADARNFQ